MAISSPFVAWEAYSASARPKCIAIAEAFLGAGSTASVATWADYHALINPILLAAGATAIADGNTGQQWLDRMNVLAAMEPEVGSLYQRFTTKPVSGRLGLQNTLIASLKVAGVWAKLDTLWVTAAADSQAARRNWKGDAYNLTAVNSPTFSADRGYTGNGSSSRLTTGYTPAAHGVQYKQDDASMWLWSRTAAQNLNADMGSGISGPHARITTRTPVDATAVRVNDGLTLSTSNTTDGSGLFGAQRRSANDLRAWRNGVQIGTATVASTGLATDEQWLLAANGVGWSSREQSVAAYGASLAGLEAQFFTAIQTYLQAVGAA